MWFNKVRVRLLCYHSLSYFRTSETEMISRTLLMLQSEIDCTCASGFSIVHQVLESVKAVPPLIISSHAVTCRRVSDKTHSFDEVGL